MRTFHRLRLLYLCDLRPSSAGLSIFVLITLSKLCTPIKSIPSLLKVYQQADSQYAFGGGGGIRTPVQNTFRLTSYSHM